MKKLLIPMIAVALAFVGSAFKPAKQTTSTFFVYTSSSTLQADIQNINNYSASTVDPCGGTTTVVCGVNLPTAEVVGQKPNSTDFSTESANLWTSEQNHRPADSNIEMQP